MSSDATSLYFSCERKKNEPDSFCPFPRQKKRQHRALVVRSIARRTASLSWRQQFTLSFSTVAGSAAAAREALISVYAGGKNLKVVLTLRGDSPPTYTNSTLCRFSMCSNICLLGRARTAGLGERRRIHSVTSTQANL